MKSPLSLSSKYNTIAGMIVGGLLMAVLIALVLIRPAYNSMKKANAQIPDTRAKLKQVEGDRDALNKAKDFFDKHDTDVSMVATAVPTQPDVPAILAILESLSKSDKVTLNSFSPQQVGVGATGSTANPATGGGTPTTDAAAAQAGVSSVDITANYSGQYSDLIRFFYDLESSLRIVDVHTINVATDKTGGNAIQGSISFRAYYKPVGTSATANPGGNK